MKTQSNPNVGNGSASEHSLPLLVGGLGIVPKIGYYTGALSFKIDSVTRAGENVRISGDLVMRRWHPFFWPFYAILPFVAMFSEDSIKDLWRQNFSDRYSHHTWVFPSNS